MISVETILHATDFSAPSEYAFRLACSLARDTKARIIVLHAAPSVEFIPDKEASYPEAFYDALEKKLRAIQPSDPQVHVEFRFEKGDPTEVILSVARQTKCDLIVLGTHGRTGFLDRLLLGSVAELIVRRATCPVLTVKSLPSKASLASSSAPSDPGQTS
jgi:nucleotide-binding universal stress UspA family protein